MCTFFSRPYRCHSYYMYFALLLIFINNSTSNIILLSCFSYDMVVAGIFTTIVITHFRHTICSRLII